MELLSRTTDTAAFLAQSRVKEVTIGYAVPIPLELLTTGLRLWVKLRTPGNSLSFDDYLMVWATIVGVAVCVSGLVYGPPYGFGRHKDALSDEQIRTFMMGNYIFSHFYDVAIASTKLAVLALYHRIFATAKFRLVVMATAIFVLLWLVTMEVVLGFQCRPIETFWDSRVAGKCFNLVAFSYFTNITNMVTDIWIFALPLPVILRLQMSRNRKIALSFLFSIGLATCGISAARLSVVVSQGSSDFTWAGVPLGILSAWEPLGAIMCANLPVIYRAMVSLFRSIRSTVTSNPQRTGNANSHQHRISSVQQSQRQWERIYHGSSTDIDYHSEVSTAKALGGGELYPMTGTIKVERHFEQEIFQEGDETPLHRPDGGYRP